MTLSAGTRLGHYDVTALLGEGGMGQVWQATDTQLGREVALKILPDAFAADPDRLARFKREAQILASLNHPNIAAIYGIEESEGTRALVLELVEGPTLADRISQEPVPVDEALLIAKQIAEALEAAHEAGVIHRDLKPANIKVREDGTVKVLDFGLAKALDPNPEGDPSQSPTLTAAATQMGVIMGTAAYMSPEQARGKPVDKRADIWAFGAVLYEMLSGKRVFDGRDVSETLAGVIKSEAPWEALPNDTPATLNTVLRRCLEKEPKHRIRDMTRGTFTRVTTDAGFDRAPIWTLDGSRLVFESDRGGTRELFWTLPASGGEQRQLTTLAAGEVAHFFPEFLPNDRAVLFEIWTGERESSQIAVYDSDVTEHRTLLPGMSPQLAASGHLVFWRYDALWAVRFDPERLEVQGTPVPVVEGVGAMFDGNGHYGLGADGTLLYVPPPRSAARRSLVWVDRQGNETPLASEPRSYNSLQLSPSDSKIVVEVGESTGALARTGGNTDIWTYDLQEARLTRFTLDPAEDRLPLWTPDGADLPSHQPATVMCRTCFGRLPTAVAKWRA